MRYLILFMLIAGVAWGEDTLILSRDYVDNYVTLPEPKHYICSKHGNLPEYSAVTFELDEPEFNGVYCMKCIAEKMKEMFPNLEPRS